MKSEVSVLDGNIFYTFISNWVISGVTSDIGTAENSLHRILTKTSTQQMFIRTLLCFGESSLLPHTHPTNQLQN